VDPILNILYSLQARGWSTKGHPASSTDEVMKDPHYQGDQQIAHPKTDRL